MTIQEIIEAVAPALYLVWLGVGILCACVGLHRREKWFEKHRLRDFGKFFVAWVTLCSIPLMGPIIPYVLLIRADNDK